MARTSISMVECPTQRSNMSVQSSPASHTSRHPRYQGACAFQCMRDRKGPSPESMFERGEKTRLPGRFHTLYRLRLYFTPLISMKHERTFTRLSSPFSAVFQRRSPCVPRPSGRRTVSWRRTRSPRPRSSGVCPAGRCGRVRPGDGSERRGRSNRIESIDLRAEVNSWLVSGSGVY